MKEIKLANNKGIALVDDEDYEMLKQHKWHLQIRGGYAATNLNKTIKIMHQLIIKTPKDMETDHIDRNPLNNQKENLRIVTHQQNQMNKKQEGGTSKYKGVSWRKDTEKWKVEIDFNNKRYNLGCFINEIDAAKAYNKAAKEFFKEYAYLNEV